MNRLKHLISGTLLIAALMIGGGISAQNIEVVSNVLNLPDAFENNPSTAQVVVYNPGIYPIEITSVDLFEIYGDEPFTVSDTAFILNPLDTQRVTVTFSPEHNIDHSMAMVFRTRSGFGHVGVNLRGQGKYSNSYYLSTENKSEEALKTALKSRLALGYNSLGYTAARDNMYATIDNSGGAVECVYTGRTANFSTRSGANSNNFNCEHTFPQGFFNQNEPMRSDIHHLFPTDVTANSKRGNDPFGVVSSASWQLGGSKSGGGKFEPRNIHKGACARGMMYFVIRYQDYSNHFAGQETILRNWHRQYPPQTAEQSRNNQIANLQNSRNPFVDYPQLEERITSFVSNSVAPVVKDLYLSDDTIELRAAAGRYQYDFVVYNKGNQLVDLSNFALSDTSLRFVPAAPLTLSLAPGAATNLSISFNSATTYFANLTFDTDLPGSSSFDIPIRSSESIGFKAFTTEPEVSVYPNPTSGKFLIESGAAPLRSIAVFTHTGLPVEVKYNEDRKEVDLSSVAPGLYLLQVRLVTDEVILKKLIRQ